MILWQGERVVPKCLRNGLKNGKCPLNHLSGNREKSSAILTNAFHDYNQNRKKKGGMPSPDSHHQICPKFTAEKKNREGGKKLRHTPADEFVQNQESNCRTLSSDKRAEDRK